MKRYTIENGNGYPIDLSEDEQGEWVRHEDVKGRLFVQVKATGLEVVKQLCNVIMDVSKDEGIPAVVREKYDERVNAILEQCNQLGVGASTPPSF